MIKRLISFILTLVFLVALPLEAAYRYNPYTRKLDYYEAAGDIVLGDIGDITLTGLANGDLLYYNGTAWVNLTIGAGATVLTVAAGIPSWQAAPAPGAHAASHEVGGADLVDHDQLTNYLAAQHLTLPNTIVAVLTDHTQAAHNALLIDADTVDGEHAAAIVTNARVKAHFPDTIANVLSDHNLLAHTALGLFDASSDVDHNATTNYAANQHVVLPATIAAVLTDHDLAAHTALGLYDAPGDVDHNLTTNYVAAQHTDHTAVSILSAGLITGGGTIDGNQTLTLTEATIEAAIDTLGAVLFTGDVTFNEDVIVTWADAADRMRIVQGNAEGIEGEPLISILDDRVGTTANEADEATLFITNEGPDSWAIYADLGKVQFDGDFILAWSNAVDNLSITQSAVAGIEGQPLIYINDDRTGATANSAAEATLVIDGAGTYALNVNSGQVYINSILEVTGTAFYSDFIHVADNFGMDFGYFDSYVKWDTNAAADDLTVWILGTLVAGETAAFFWSNLDPNGMTDHDNYLSPTFILTNDEAADANDYSGVVIGERAQASVLVAHYFDFYAMTGASDGAVNPANAEMAAIFRFGASGSATPGYATTPGDVLFEGTIEIDGNQQNAGYNRFGMIYWIECFDHGIAANRYSQNWDITSLNTQGNGTNTIDTTPSHITLTTDNNGVGDNEGTITHFQIVERARQNRSEFGVDLGQTANTQFYCGWNTSQTNAMVAAADEYVIVFFDVSDNANWQIKVGDGATEDVFTSAVAADTNDIRHEIWAETDGTVHWRVNGTELDITGSVDNLMTANDHYLIFGQAQSVTGAAAIVAEIDWVENEKSKVH